MTRARITACVAIPALSALSGAADARQQVVSLPFVPDLVGPGVPAFAVREGYRVTLAADGVQNARFLEFGARGEVYVSRPDRGDILCMRDADADGAFDENERTTFLRKPRAHAMCFTEGRLWFATSTGVYRTSDADADGVADEVVAVIAEGSLPGGTGHWWRSLLVGPDRLYTSVGDSGNITDESRTDRQKMFTFALDGSRKRLFASGIRNTEKLRFRPKVAPDGSVTLTDEVWGVDHGSDNFGAEYGERGRARRQPITDIWPPDEFNHYVEGGFYGHPFLTGPGIPRSEHRYHDDLIEMAARHTPPAWLFGAHWAANGWTFLTTDALGSGHAGDALVALHGSWNSSVRVGYGVERTLFDRVTGRPYGALRLVNTTGADGAILARPVDCAEGPDGSVLFSCDATGRVFRISKAP